uniref:tripartite tricarboxylate transporter TctB family protein n=1 Tax=Pararhizobium sp. IMCC3301 TaxID=3067904 RepID=UPI00274280D0|nr:tripartite tricarboxylate transporter TctB family protein [Pararhizobium sp. IMCC3301]
MDRKIDFITVLLALVVGLVFLWQAWAIPVGASDSIGPRLVPLIIAMSAIGLAGVQLYFDFHADGVAGTELAGDDHISIRSLFLQAGPLILAAVLYGQMMVWFGYLVATFVAALLVFRLYANSLALTLVNSTAGSLIFYIAFIKGMGIYDPPGTILDISGFLTW